MILSRKDIIEHSFGSSAMRYDTDAIIQKEVAQSLSDKLPNKAYKNILEIGCGTGFLTRHLIKRFPEARILATDISQDMLNFCENQFRSHSNVFFQKMDGENPDLNQEFDLIISSLSVQWFSNPFEGLNRLKRYLFKKGDLYFSTLGESSFKEWSNSIDKAHLPSGLLRFEKYEGIFDEERKEVNYGSSLKFLRHLKKTGAVTPKQNYKPLNARELLKACSKCDQDYDGKITWHIIYGYLKPLQQTD